MLLELITINLVLIFLIDFSGFVPEFKRFLSRVLSNSRFSTDKFSLKPFDCSFCMTFWCTLLFTIVSGEFTIVNILLLITVTWLTDVTRQILLLLKDLLIKLINTIYDRL